MKKIIVIGCPGSGKSTFSRRLSALFGLPVVHLDLLFWNADRTTVSRGTFDERLEKALAEDEWIIDGNYARTLERRLSSCDAVFFLDLPTEDCLRGVQLRKNKPRPDFPWIETEDDPELIAEITGFRSEVRPDILRLLEKYPEKELTVFHSHAEIDAFFEPRLRPATEDELAEIAGLYAQAASLPDCTWDEDYPTLADARRDFLSGGLYVYTLCGRIIGAASVIAENEYNALPFWKEKSSAREIARVVIAPPFRGNGYAAKMLAALCSVLKEQSASAVHLLAAKSNPAAVKTYEKLGFSFLGEHFCYGIHFFVCEKKL